MIESGSKVTLAIARHASDSSVPLINDLFLTNKPNVILRQGRILVTFLTLIIILIITTTTGTRINARCVVFRHYFYSGDDLLV